MQRYFMGVLLAVFGCALIRAAITEDYRAWVAQSPALVIAAGVGMIALAVVALWSPNDHHSGSCIDDGCGCADESGQKWAPWALALIVAAVAGINPSEVAPSNVAQANQAVTVTNKAQPLPPLPDGVPQISLQEVVARSVAPTDTRGIGRQVMVSGQLHTSETGQRILSRVAITCCAADARSYEVELMDPLGIVADMADEEWVEVTATLQPGTGTIERQWIPQVIVGSAQPTTETGYEIKAAG